MEETENVECTITIELPISVWEILSLHAKDKNMTLNEYMIQVIREECDKVLKNENQ